MKIKLFTLLILLFLSYQPTFPRTISRFTNGEKVLGTGTIALGLGLMYLGKKIMYGEKPFDKSFTDKLNKELLGGLSISSGVLSIAGIIWKFFERKI